MSTSGLNVSSTSSSPSSSAAGSQLLQITGLASGLDTNSIINALMAIDRQPETQLQNQQKGLTAQKSALTNIQTALQTLALNASALDDPGLWANTQAVSSSDPTRVSASMASGSGAGIGGYQVSVTQLANSSQKTFTYNAPTSDETISLSADGVGSGAANGQYNYSMTITAGESIDAFVNSINADSNSPVYAAKTAANTVVLSERQSGKPGTYYIQVGGDTQGALTQTAQKDGQDALYSVDASGQLDSRSNAVTGAIAGVNLTLNAVTTTSGPVTVNVGAPAPNAASIQSAVKAFVDSYNSIIGQINTQLTTKTVSTDPTVGTLFGDSELTNLLGNMRQAIYTPVSGLTGAITSLSQIGVTTGAASGSATFSQDSVDGKLTIDTTALTNAIQSNPNGVKQMLQSWSTGFAQIVNNEAQSGGTLDSRINGDTAQINDISDQISSLEAVLADRQTALQAQFANLEALLSQNQAQSSWLSSQINQLPGWTG